MKRIIVMMCMVLVGLGMAGCSKKNEMQKEKITSTPSVTNDNKEVLSTDDIVPTQELMKEIESTSKPVPTSIPEPTTTPIENSSREYLMEQAIDAEFTKIKKMMNDGTISGYVRGDTKFLVWKSVAMGINSVKNYKFAILNHNGDFEKDFFAYDFELRNGISEIKHVGSNIFEIAIVDGKMMYHDIEKNSFFSFNKNDKMYYIFEEFSDGYAVISSMYPSYEEKGENFSRTPYYELLLLSDTGKLISTNVYKRQWSFDSEEDRVGKYGNGVFFYSDAFYDSTGIKVLDLSNVFIENEPYFVGDYCWIEYHDFEFVWGAWMDIKGNFKEEARKLRELDWD